MPSCGSQITLCDLPVRFDTYKGCSHACKYCFVYRKYDISKVEKAEGVVALQRFIDGHRSSETDWCDWDIPLHWGGMSDPFQPIEAVHKVSLECLKILAKTQYPFVVSTKGTTLLASDEYLQELSKCNAVVQVSLVSPQYDKLETGAPTFAQRLRDIAIISKHCKRVIVRIQPYVREVKRDILANLESYKQAGVYGVTIEGIKHISAKAGLVKCGGDFVYPVDVLERDYKQIKEACHRVGLAFFCAENRLRGLGDDLCCCGIAGLDGFTGNKANIAHYVAEGELEFTECMKSPKQGNQVFRAIMQESIATDVLRKHSFAEIMTILSKDKKLIESLSK